MEGIYRKYTLEELIKYAKDMKKKGDFGKVAIQLNEEIIRREEKNIYAYTRLGQCYRANGNDILAELAFFEAKKIDSKNIIVRNEISNNYILKEICKFIIGFDELDFFHKQLKIQEKIRIYKDEFLVLLEEVKKIKVEYRFKGLWHFTDFSNIDSILSSKQLCSRKYCSEKSISFRDGANHEVLDKTLDFVKRCTRFYFRPSTPMLYDVEGVKSRKYSNQTHMPIPVYLLFSEELIYLRNTYFSQGNATISTIGKKEEVFCNMEWEKVFHDKSFSKSEKKEILKWRHAEVLRPFPVDLKYLKKVIFRTKADLKRAMYLWGNNEKFIVNRQCFSYKYNLKELHSCYNNFIEDYYIENNNEFLEISIKFDKHIGEFDIIFYIRNNYNPKKYIKVYGQAIKKVSYLYRDELENNYSEEKFYEMESENISIAEANIVTWKLNYKFEKGDIINVYFNDVLSIEEVIELGEEVR